MEVGFETPRSNNPKRGVTSRPRLSRYAHGGIHTNTEESAFALVKRNIVDAWYKVNA
jgi:hypothetical protein